MNPISTIGANMSLLLRGVHSLVTENETGDMLRQRVAEIRADAQAIVHGAEKIAVARGFAGSLTLCPDCDHEECDCANELRRASALRNEAHKVILESYLAMERLMVKLDRQRDPNADVLRDIMNPIWYALSDEQHRLLGARIGDDPSAFAGTVGSTAPPTPSPTPPNVP